MKTKKEALKDAKRAYKANVGTFGYNRTRDYLLKLMFNKPTPNWGGVRVSINS